MTVLNQCPIDPPAENLVSAVRLRTIWLIAGLAFLAFAWYGSLVPLHFSPRPLADAWGQFANSGVLWSGGSRVDWGVNVMLFIPAGFCLLAAAIRADLPVGQRILRTIGVAALCLMMSLLIEFSQSWFPPRVPTLSDVAAQFCGAAAGLAGWWLCGKSCDRAVADLVSDTHPHRQLGLILLGYMVVLVFFLLAPLDLTLRPAELMRKYRDGRILVVPFSYSYDSLLRLAYNTVADIILFIPVGVFATTFLTRQKSEARSLPLSLLLGCVIVLGVEIAQLLVMSRFTDATDLVTGGLGVAIGVLGIPLLLPAIRGNSVPFATSPIAAAGLHGSVFPACRSQFCGHHSISSSTTPHGSNSECPSSLACRCRERLAGNYLAAFDGFCTEIRAVFAVGRLNCSCRVRSPAGISIRNGARTASPDGRVRPRDRVGTDSAAQQVCQFRGRRDLYRGFRGGIVVNEPSLGVM